MHRRIAALLLNIIIIIAFLCPYALSEPVPEPTLTPQQAKEYSKLTADWLDCTSAILIDEDSGNVLFAKNEKARMHPASTTKIMTLLLAIESGIPLDRQIAIPQAAADVPKDSSLVPVYPGETMTFGDLLLGLSINSGNDAANAVAVLIAGTVDNFIKLMNSRAAELGCIDTHFANAHGYTADNHYTTAYDLAIITRKALQYDAFRRISQTVDTPITVNERGTINLKTQHMLMRADGDYYYKYCTGVKTGTTEAAGKCFVGSAEKDGARLISVVLNCSTDAKRWIDTAYMFEYGWTCYDAYTLEQMYSIASPQIANFVVSNAAEEDADGGRLKLEIAQLSSSSYLRMVERNNTAALNEVVQDFVAGSRMEITHDMTAPITKGEVMGTYSFTDSKTGEVITATLVAGRDVAAQPERKDLISYLKKSLPFLNILNNTLFIILLIVLLIILVLVIALIVTRRVQKQRNRRRILERKRREYIRRQRMQAARNAGASSAPVRRGTAQNVPQGRRAPNPDDRRRPR